MPPTHTMIAAPGASFPTRIATPIIEVKPAAEWIGDWRITPELRLRRCKLAVCGDDLSVAELEWRYGSLFHPFDSPSPMQHDITDFRDHWVRIRLVHDDGIATQWVGRISSLVPEPHGKTGSVSGKHHWVAYGPLHILRRIHVSESYWLDGGQEKLIGWAPSFNARDAARNLIVGNRSAETSNGTYVFGGSSVWTRRQIAEYLLERFVNDPQSGAYPAWTLGGQLDLLDQGSDTLQMGATQTIGELLGRLISPRYGVDYLIAPTDTGFELFVYALQSEEYTFNGVSLPRNPNEVRISVADNKDVETVRVQRSGDQRYERIRVLGGRIVVVASLRGSFVPDNQASTLREAWTDALEQAYIAGDPTPGATPADHDEFRKDERFRPVFSTFVAIENWDRDGGFANPKLDRFGQFVATDYTTPFQNSVRKTLSWTPLQEGVDYYESPPVIHNQDGVVADFLPPQAFVYDYETERYVAADQAGISVSALQSDLGVYLGATPRHLLAKTDFDGETETEALYDYHDLVVTAAFETDARLRLEIATPGARPEGGVMEIDAQDAELWYLAPQTVFSLNADGTLRTVSIANRILRDDGPRLSLIMAGAIARYFHDRARAQVVYKGLIPQAPLLGQILTVVDDGGELHSIKGAITAVEWFPPGSDGDAGRTVVHAGYTR